MKQIKRNLAFVVMCAAGLTLSGCSQDSLDDVKSSNTGASYTVLEDVVLIPALPISLDYSVAGSLEKKVQIFVDNPASYASLSIIADGKLVLDALNIPKAGPQQLDALLRFDGEGPVTLTVKSNAADLKLESLVFEDVVGLDIPSYKDISVQAGIDKVSSLKYAGPTIADIDWDGDYDFIVNNHNDASSKLYWNNGDGTVTKHNKDLARWFMHDLHGTAAGDYDNDGDLDLVVTQGGGNGQFPSKANFYTNNNGTFVLTTGDVGIDRGGRGRGAKWTDMDLDGDLDLMLINETSLTVPKPQHYFHENMGDGTFIHRPIAGMQDQHQSRALLTDLNNDNIDDLVLYGPLSVWLGNGDFTFTDISHRFSEEVLGLRGVMAVTDIDIDNDGDQDLYLARGKEFEHGKGEAPSIDFDPQAKEFAIKTRGYKGVDAFDFTAHGEIKLHNYYFLTQGAFRDKDYPIFLGADKAATVVDSGGQFSFKAEQAQGWPEDRSADGLYFGYLGEGRWKAELVRNTNNFWSYRFNLSGLSEAKPLFTPDNRNIADVLLRNDGEQFVDVSREWSIPSGGNSLGVTRGDFNNDSYQDLFVYRWGSVASRISDFMLLNNGQGQFHTVTMHGANDVGGPGNGDMGQAFDFDLDGDLDILSGSEYGEWYLYENAEPGQGNYALVKVDYSPKANIDPISAEVIVKTANAEYRKRVGSAGAVFSQSLLNTVHFGLGEAQAIKKITIRWRNGETVEFNNKKANQLFDSNQLDPQSIELAALSKDIRKGASMPIKASLTPEKADSRLLWSSSDNKVLKVDQSGLVTALGDEGEKAVITAKSEANGLSSSQELSVVGWFAKPLTELSLTVPEQRFYVGTTIDVQSTFKPLDADDKGLSWSSSNEAVATVDANGKVSALTPGRTMIKAITAANNQLSDSLELVVEAFVEGGIELLNEQAFKDGSFKVGDELNIQVRYHAGSGNKVIASDEGGIRYWLRHFKYKWIPAKDRTFIDSTVLGTEAGSSSMTISLDGLTPTAELPEGHFYQLRASFAGSDGKMHDVKVDNLNIVK
ncbi:FG-GAP-like repeat-containing protein [Agaribacterium sp. ZY112]|uniref:FG-GAP-like repeat-containing protein n=1 Tax=Agaribacterium sp. ZY112 TaxID=3233574 RepID=UPI003524CFDA